MMGVKCKSVKWGLYGLFCQNPYFTTFKTSMCKKKKKTLKDGEWKKSVCLLGKLEQAIDYKEQKK